MYIIYVWVAVTETERLNHDVLCDDAVGGLYYASYGQVAHAQGQSDRDKVCVRWEDGNRVRRNNVCKVPGPIRMSAASLEAGSAASRRRGINGSAVLTDGDGYLLPAHAVRSCRLAIEPQEHAAH